MIKLLTSGGENVSKILKEVSPMIYTSNRQENLLLDGSYHVQIIGSPIKSMEATIIASYTQADKINELADQGALFILVFLDKQYQVFINKAISWKRINFAHGDLNKSYFEGKVQMIIEEEVL